MLFDILKELNFENHEFKNNEIILTNAHIFDAYFYYDSKDTIANEIDVYLPARISHSNTPKYVGHFLYDTNKLLDYLLNCFTQIRNMCCNEEIKDYINHKSNNADFDKRFLNLKHYQHHHQKPNTNVINSIINFFESFGFPFDCPDNVSIIKLKYTVLPKILILSLLNNLYETITLLSSDDITLTYSEKLLKQKFDTITFTLNFFFNSNIIIENNFDIYDINFIVSDFRVNLLNIINHFSTFFRSYKSIFLYGFFRRKKQNNSLLK